MGENQYKTGCKWLFEVIRCFLVLLLLTPLCDFSHAMTEEETRIIKESVLELCRGGSSEGKASSVLIKAEGKITTVFLKKLAQADLGGEAEFSNEEWQGIKPLLPESFDSNAYVKCVTELTPIFLDKFSESSGKATPDPKISTFQVTPSAIKEGGKARLEWIVKDASTVEIDQGIGNVPLSGSRILTPLKTTSYVLTAKQEDVTRRATAQVIVTPLTREEKNSIGALSGDKIYEFKVLEYGRDYLLAELTYNFNSQHGPVWIGGYLLDENDQSISAGFQPVGASQSGKSIVRVNVDSAKGRVGSKWVYFWLYESNKSLGFVSKRFQYPHYWN